jgi:hypothetical protein
MSSERAALSFGGCDVLGFGGSTADVSPLS